MQRVKDGRFGWAWKLTRDLDSVDPHGTPNRREEETIPFSFAPAGLETATATATAVAAMERQCLRSREPCPLNRAAWDGL